VGCALGISCRKQPFYFRLDKNNRQFFNPGTLWDLKLGIVPFTNMPVKADNAGYIRITAVPRQFTIFKQIADIVLNLVVGQFRNLSSTSIIFELKIMASSLAICL
jgi:hypothetical protein